ncbi:MAG: HAD-IA family hydrolase [Clostridiales bacterium]|nr:HAD-IA family hydrolase [Clostridiales bacterium]
MPLENAKEKVYALFESLGISYTVADHPPMFTQQDNIKHKVEINAVIFKNLFLRNKNKSRYYLVSLPLEKKADLYALQALLGETRLSFGSEQDLKEKLGIQPGSVSLLNIIGVEKTDATLLIDRCIFNYERIGVHPNDNTATIIFDPKDLSRILDFYGASHRFIDIAGRCPGAESPVLKKEKAEGIKAALFDLDGTLANTVEDLASAANHALDAFGYPQRQAEDFKTLAGNGASIMLQKALPEEIRSSKQARELLPSFLEFYSRHCVDKTFAYPGVSELLKKLKREGIRLAVVTNKAQEMADIVIKHLYPRMFDAVFGQVKGIPLKPDPTSARMAMSMLGTLPGECIFVGDSGVDMKTAENCGALSIGVSWGFRQKDELEANGARHVVDSPDDILRIVESLSEATAPEF